MSTLQKEGEGSSRNPTNMGHRPSKIKARPYEIPPPTISSTVTIKFGVLIVGRANAGKTSLLQRVCNITNSPIVWQGNKGVCGI